jgi:thiamine-phosphate pyrophosphorylase
MFEKGLTLFHLRKPDYNSERLSVYLNKINRKFHHRIVIHSCYGLLTDYNLRGIHIRAVEKDQKESFAESYKNRDDLSISISYHTLNELADNTGNVDYAFLSPVFDSISKSGYKAGFDQRKLADKLGRIELDTIALGGCRAEYLPKIKKLGFAGAAFLGAVWNSSDPVSAYLTIMEAEEQLTINN